MSKIDHSGDILPSGIRIIEKTKETKEYGGHLFPIYIQWCPNCKKKNLRLHMREKERVAGALMEKTELGKLFQVG